MTITVIRDTNGQDVQNTITKDNRPCPILTIAEHANRPSSCRLPLSIVFAGLKFHVQSLLCRKVIKCPLLPHNPQVSTPTSSLAHCSASRVTCTQSLSSFPPPSTHSPPSMDSFTTLFSLSLSSTTSFETSESTASNTTVPTTAAIDTDDFELADYEKKTSSGSVYCVIA